MGQVPELKLMMMMMITGYFEMLNVYIIAGIAIIKNC